jgi:hypothetical protein
VAFAVVIVAAATPPAAVAANMSRLENMVYRSLCEDENLYDGE